jgi:hypothetical protein
MRLERQAMFKDRDTDWARSAKGNQWKRQNGKVLVVGQKKDGSYWALIGSDFVKGSFQSEFDAKIAAEENLTQPFGDLWVGI